MLTLRFPGVVVGAWLAAGLLAAAEAPVRLPPDGWGGRHAEVSGLPGRRTLAVAYPQREAGRLEWVNATPLPAGVYRLTLAVAASHTGDGIAFNAGLRVFADAAPAADFPGIYFARVHEAEARTVEVVHRNEGRLALALEAYADPAICQLQFTRENLAEGGPALSGAEALAEEEGEELDPGLMELEFVASPAGAVYYVLEDAALVALSRSAAITGLETDRIRYDPGAVLRGVMTLESLSAGAAEGVVNLYLEHGLDDRRRVAELPARIEGALRLPFEVTLPAEELGYALVAEFVSADGRDRVERSEYFTIAENFYRVAIHTSRVMGRSPHRPEASLRQDIRAVRAAYQNCTEVFAWAEEDMVEMSPETDWWFSGQTCYHMSRAGLQRMIRAAHEQGVSVVTYGKFVMSGYLGWRTAYDYPHDHRAQYSYPVGMWEGVNGVIMDRFRNKEFVPHDHRPTVYGDNPFEVGWQEFLPINPDATPRMTRIAAEEVIRAIEMFGWDGVRWDGHPRGGGPCGGAGGEYSPQAARVTQTLVRYFKDIVNAAHPRFRHGYNYLMVQDEPARGWAFEDYELDELCRGGGLLMNESIRNSAGRPFGWMARNIQVEGDLCRERGGYLLGISCDGASPRDVLVEAVLYFAGGCRPMGLAASHPLVNRYGTRFAQYTFDETLRRLEHPEAVLRPDGETEAWWQPFVYETAPRDGRRQLVVNVLNIPRQESPKEEKAQNFSWRMNPGTAPFTMSLELPAGYRAVGARLIDPFSLDVTTAEADGDGWRVPPVAVWRVLVIDLEVADDAPTLAALGGTPVTFRTPRAGLTEPRPDPLTLDIGKSVVEVNKDMAFLASAASGGDARTRLGELDWAARQKALQKIRDANPPESFLAGWWKGGSLPADLRLKDAPPAFGDFAPRRDGRLDVYYARGAMDYRLRIWEALAGVDRFRAHEALLTGVLRQSPGMGLSGGVDWERFPEFDVLLYTGVPHCAIGAGNSYALVEYVKAGGGVLFTGGEYAFGKGGYMHTVLERELLPVLCSETVDVEYADTAQPLEPGPDFADLATELDFAARPVFWCANRVIMKDAPGVKVFLKSGSQPVLVGWQLGAGRVACLLADHRGKSEDGLTMFFDWPDWPRLMRAILAWLAPDAGRSGTGPAAPDAAATAAALKDIEAATLDDIGAVAEATVSTESPSLLDDIGGEPGLATPAVREMGQERLARRLAIINQALDGNGPELAGLLAGQLAAVPNLPVETGHRILDFVRRHPPPGLADTAAQCLGSGDHRVRGAGYQLLALANPAAFLQALTAPPPANEVDPRHRRRCLALGIPLVHGDILAAEGRRRVAEWNGLEKGILDRWTGGGPFTLEAPHHPGLDAENLFERIAWLTYLTRLEPETYGEQFAHEWLMTAQYQDYCDRSIAAMYGLNMTQAEIRRAQIRSVDWNLLRTLLGRLRETARPDLEALLERHPAVAAAGLRQAHFTLEASLCMNLLGDREPAASQALLDGLTQAGNADLAEFVRARRNPK